MTKINKVPRFLKTDAERVAWELFGIKAESNELYSYQDQNFLLQHKNGDRSVLKIANLSEKKRDMEIQNNVMLHLHQNSSPPLCPKPIPARSGETLVTIQDKEGDIFFVRLLTYLKGITLAESRPHSPALMYDLGRFIGRMVRSFQSAPKIKFRTDFFWNMFNGPETVKKYRIHINNQDHQILVDYYLNLYARQAVPLLPNLSCGLIQNDANDHNILVSPHQDQSDKIIQRSIAGVIDFGDMVYSYVLCELANALAYIMMEKNHPLEIASRVLSGYSSVVSLSETELNVLFPMICMRLITSVSFSACQKKSDPDNKYLIISEKPAWALLKRLKIMYPHSVSDIFRKACGEKYE